MHRIRHARPRSEQPSRQTWPVCAPIEASARLSFRLVDGQRPEHIRALFRNFVEARLPAGCRVEFEGAGGNSAVSVNEASPYIAATVRALDAEWPEPTLIKGTGGTIPLVGLLTDRLDVDCIVTGFILADDAIHAPNERYGVERLRMGIRSWVRILAGLTVGTGRAGGCGHPKSEAGPVDPALLACCRNLKRFSSYTQISLANKAATSGAGRSSADRHPFAQFQKSIRPWSRNRPSS